MGVGRHISHGNGREWESKYCSHTPLTQSDSQLAARGDAACFSALEVFLNDMRYINLRFTYLLTYLLTYLPPLPWQLDFFVFNIVIHVRKNTTVASRGKRTDSR